MMEDDQPATAETIIHALSQFGAEQEHQQGEDGHASDQLENYTTLLSHADQGIENNELGGLSRGELEAEVLKLRSLINQDSVSTLSNENLTSAKKRKRSGSKAVEKIVDIQTGKRVERGRKTELYRAIRQTMRLLMGMEKDTDPLPAPKLAESSTADHVVWVVPDWQAPLGDRANSSWMASIATDLQYILNTETDRYPKVDETDKDLSTILDAVKVTFANYVKRYKSENDSTHAERKARYAKNRRRWARKDLKQEKRSKARDRLDPAHSFATLPTEALLFDCLSSEYSSSGSDSSDDDDVFHTEKVKQRKEVWSSMRKDSNQGATQAAKGKEDQVKEGQEYGWGIGLGSKVLEVRTPSWRSDKLNDYYAHLDSLSDIHARNRNTPRSQSRLATTTKAGHVAPSHRRFTLPTAIRRRGSGPRSLRSKGCMRKVAGGGETRMKEDWDDGDGGEGWMWSTGRIGVWPARSGIGEQSEQIKV